MMATNRLYARGSEYVAVDLGWRRSSHSGSQGNCIEAAALRPVNWRPNSRGGSEGNSAEAALSQSTSWARSRRSGTSGNYVEVAGRLRSVVAVRDSKDPGGAKLIFPARAWRLFTGALKTAVPAQF
jgi:hypothetical protein